MSPHHCYILFFTYFSLDFIFYRLDIDFLLPQQSHTQLFQNYSQMHQISKREQFWGVIEAGFYQLDAQH